MKRVFGLVACVLGGMWISALTAPARAASESQPTTQATTAPAPTFTLSKEVRDAQDNIRMVFAAKCDSCHGPQAVKPKKYDYGNDFKKMAANDDLVVAGKPEESGLFTEINEGNMPPRKAAQLTPGQRDLVLASLKTWISAGAPAQETLTVGAAAVVDDPPIPFQTHLIGFLGKFHPLLAHFPIALLITAAVAELIWLTTRQSWLTGVVRFCTLFGALGAVVTAGLGWADAAKMNPSDLLTLHRWLGTGAAIWALPVLLLSERGFKRRRDNLAGDPKPWFQLMLFAGVVLVGIAAHFGGDLVYGTNFLTW